MIKTRSRFIYGYNIDFNNRVIDFNDGIPRRAILRPRGWTLTQLRNEVERAMNIASSQTYEVEVNRETRQFTIKGTANFNLTVSTDSALPLIGFTESVSDSDEYTGGTSGSSFVPQLKLQDYTPFEKEIERRLAVENVSASGRVEQVDYGRDRFMTCQVRYQTDKKVGFLPFNENAVQELTDFLEYIIQKRSIEFMPDADDFNNFISCVYDGRPSFRLRESDDLDGFYDSGRLIFREV